MENNVLEWHYLQTTDRTISRSYKTSFNVVFFEIMELTTSLKNMSEFEITSLIGPHLSQANNKKQLQHLNISVNLMEYFVAKKFCDITIQVRDKSIQAHKVVLAAGSPIWHDLFNADMTIAVVRVDDYEYEIIKKLIEYMYTGIVKKPMQAFDCCKCI